MREPLWVRIKQWWCTVVGHRMDGKPWWFKDHRHECCLRCRRIISMPAPKEVIPTHVEAWVGWHLNSQGVPAPMICDHNPGQLAHTTRYRFEIPQDVLEHLAGTRECLMLNKFGKMHKDCREES